MRRSRSFVVALLCAACLSVATAATSLDNSNVVAPDLLSKATPLRGGVFPLAHDNHSWANHFWRSSSKLLVVYKARQNPGEKECRIRAEGLNVVTGRHTSAPQLPVGPGIDGEYYAYHGNFQPEGLSPDGHWLLGTRNGLPQSAYGVVEVGNHRRIIYGEYNHSFQGCDLHWLPDSQRWFYWNGIENNDKLPRAVVFSLAHPSLKPQPEIVLIKGLPAGPDHMRAGSVLTVTSDGRVLYGVEQGRTFDIYAFRLNAGATAKRIASLHLPFSSFSASGPDIIVSPDGKWLALNYDNTMYDKHGNTIVANSAWICRWDGSGLRLIGSIPFHRDRDSVGSLLPVNLYDLQWRPDDKALSFFYGDQLWVVPVRSDIETGHAKTGPAPFAVRTLYR